MPVGIDTEIFVPPTLPAPARTILFLGRLDTVKRPELFLEALAILMRRGVPFRAEVCGSPTDPQSPNAQRYAELAAPLVSQGILTLSLGVPHTKTPELYRAYAIYVNLTASGSFDKTIGEAMASGSTVVVANEALRNVVPDEFIVGDSAESVAQALDKACSMKEEERRVFGEKARAYILQEHSLPLLIRRLQAILGNKPSMQ